MRKLNWRGEFRYAWRGRVLSRDAESLVLEAHWEGPGEPLVGEIAFRLHDRFVEHYYPERAYAVWQIEAPEGTLKGWYCNISAPVVEEQDTLTFRDLLLDVVAYPDGRYLVLDREEFETAQRQGLSPGDAEAAEQALAAVIAMIENIEPPFVFSAPPRLVEAG